MKKIILLTCILYVGFTFSYEKVLMISIPKCGTYLLMNALDFLMDINCQDWPKDQFTLNQKEIDFMCTPLFAGHILYNKKNRTLIEKNNFTVFFIIRDPRDQCVSMMYWVRKHPMSRAIVKDMDNDTLLATLITDHLAIYPEAIKSKYDELIVVAPLLIFIIFFCHGLHMTMSALYALKR